MLKYLNIASKVNGKAIPEIIVGRHENSLAVQNLLAREIERYCNGSEDSIVKGNRCGSHSQHRIIGKPHHLFNGTSCHINTLLIRRFEEKADAAIRMATYKFGFFSCNIGERGRNVDVLDIAGNIIGVVR